MDTKRIYTNCKHWIYSCPQRNNESMAKTEPDQLPVQYPTQYDFDIINKLCAVCPKFEEND